LTDREVVSLVNSKHIPFYKIEQMVGDHEKGVRIRQVTEKFNMAHFINSFRVLTSAVGLNIQTQPRLTVHKSVKYFKRQNDHIPDVHRNSVYTLL